MPRLSPFVTAPVLALAAAVLSASPGLASDAKKCLTNAFEYKNHGGYKVCRIELDWEDVSGEKHSTGIDTSHATTEGCIFEGQTWNYDLAKHAESLGIAEGDEVWIKIHISQSTDGVQNCRKDGHKLIYNAGGGKIAFKTGGTTNNDNRCEYVNISDQCIQPE